MFWIGIGAYVTKPDLGRAPISLDGCPNTTTFTNLTQTMSNYTYSTTASLYNTTTTTPSAVDQWVINTVILPKHKKTSGHLYVLGQYVYLTRYALTVGHVVNKLSTYVRHNICFCCMPFKLNQKVQSGISVQKLYIFLFRTP